MWLLVAFIAVPVIEIALFIQVGGVLGTFPTLGIVILTAVLGTYLMRVQGAMAMANLRNSFSDLQDPTEPLAHGAMILVAGVLLLTPGFFTDGLGFLLLFPPFRVAAFGYLKRRVNVQSFSMGSGAGMHRGPMGGQSDVVDGEYDVIDRDADQIDKPSGWTKD